MRDDLAFHLQLSEIRVRIFVFRNLLSTDQIA